jgi:S1-C subfamily serine protease
MDEQKQIDDLVEQLDSNRIDRRELVRRASSLGLSATAIGAALTRVEHAAAQNGPPDDGIAEGDTTMVEGTGASTLAQLSDDLANAVERAGAATVTVNARRRMPASGIVWSEDGLVVTANHVVEQDEEITLGLPDGRTVKASLVGRDPGSDLALLQIASTDATGLTPAPRAESAAKIGHFVLAVARPGPSGPMASFGVVSVVGGAWRTPQGGTVEGFVRADVAMLPGFSGGPLVDARGTVLGLNSSTLGRGGGLTVPAAAIDKVVQSLRTHGKVPHGFLGIGAQAAKLPAALVAAYSLAREQGLLVVSVEPESPAERDGLMIGDIIVALNSEPVAEVEELQDRLTSDWVGQALPIRVIRGGAPQELRVTVGERG